MPRYFFDVVNGHGLERDEQGKDLLSRDKIPTEVAAILADIAREELPTTPLAMMQVNVRDDAGKNVYHGELSFRGEWDD
ncbi:hypothetical protein KX729_30405 [Rhizobium sp. XQZ8]|uniref:DUF6894 family protein n=1 Tax=Rhizobium populisoli TaxID=2859785 RepID=UPI001CA5A81B|nr:hypothetical protein [Rhizobium populisoli]MBW6425706.1 hypothetical protein [Rhizobium populisoli]